MKSTIVPAQVTTVEDKIAGNLSLSQLLLLTTPAFVGTSVYIIFPPSLKMSAYKIALVILFTAIFGLLAIRIKGKILLLWAVIILRYNLRPRHYVFDKNDLHLRELEIEAETKPVADELAEQKKVIAAQPLTIAETIMLDNIASDPRAKLYFKTDRKGVLRVHIDEVK